MIRKSEEFPESETIQRRDAALRRALQMPPKPHEPLGKKKRKTKRQRAPFAGVKR